MWAAVTVTCLVAVFVLLLSVPVYMLVHLDVHGQARPRSTMRLVWLFGLVSREIKRERPKPGGKKKKARRKAGLVETGRGIRTLLEILRIKGLLRQTLRLVREVLRQVRVRHLDVDMKIGLDNPADTGFLFAVVGPALVFLGPAFPGRMSLQPAFGDGAVCDGYLHGVLGLQPIRLVVPLGRFIFSLALLRLGRTVIRRRWKARR